VNPTLDHDGQRVVSRRELTPGTVSMSGRGAETDGHPRTPWDSWLGNRRVRGVQPLFFLSRQASTFDITTRAVEPSRPTSVAVRAVRIHRNWPRSPGALRNRPWTDPTKLAPPWRTVLPNRVARDGLGWVPACAPNDRTSCTSMRACGACHPVGPVYSVPNATKRQTIRNRAWQWCWRCAAVFVETVRSSHRVKLSPPAVATHSRLHRGDRRCAEPEQPAQSGSRVSRPLVVVHADHPRVQRP